jgi:hypothetical protein
MSNRHYTARGEQIDMNALAMKHSTTPALGNAKMNARGDVLGEGGIVLKTQEQIEAEWKRNKEQRAASVGISPDIRQPLPNSGAPSGKKLTDDQDFEPTVQTKGDQVKNLMQQSQSTGAAKRRKIVDTDQ